jgi:hypothetical protein
MSAHNIATALAYYKAINHKTIGEVEHTLHPDIQLISPLTHTIGKEAVLNAVKGYMGIVKSLNVRTACGSEDQVMLVYDYSVNVGPKHGEPLHAAVLMQFKDDLIIRIELFFDARPFAH